MLIYLIFSSFVVVLYGTTNTCLNLFSKYFMRIQWPAAVAAPSVNPWNLNGGLKSPDGNGEPLQFPGINTIDS